MSQQRKDYSKQNLKQTLKDMQGLDEVAEDEEEPTFAEGLLTTRHFTYHII